MTSCIHHRPTYFGNAGSVDARTRGHRTLHAEGRVDSTSITFTGSPEQERAIRRHERALIGSLLDAAITEKQHVSLQLALQKLDPEAARAAGTVIHLLTSILADDAAEQAA